MKTGSFLFGYQAPPIPSVSALIIRNKKILVINLTYKNGYALPGGVIKGNENYEEAVKREVKEETGLEVLSLNYFGSYAVVDQYSKINLTFKVKVKGELKSSKEGNPIWIDPKKALQKFVYKDNRMAIKALLKMNF